ncbi:hypothetical protein [Tepidibacter aestuarii]|uniref:hypothetical protein n=1 Tax=Tepidibacter aestuarii TaxID=2925782 RepID=UPI0020BFAA3D|nr:hypothetical protein [Tepidibacter aestuarii]
MLHEIFIFIVGRGNYAAGELALTNIMVSQGLFSIIAGVLIGLIPDLIIGVVVYFIEIKMGLF